MMKTHLDIHSSINDFVKEDMRRANVFEALGIDACCGGAKSLAEACQHKGLDPETVLDQLDIVDDAVDSAAAEKDWSQAGFTELATHIEETHHTYLKKALPRLSALIAKVEGAHAKRHPELLQVSKAFAALRADLEPHMMKEEQVLFPMLRQLDSGTGSAGIPEALTKGPIRVMRMEHQRAEGLQDEIRTLTKNFAFPEDGCQTYRRMLDELKTLDEDLQVHIYKEDEILFARSPGIDAI